MKCNGVAHYSALAPAREKPCRRSCRIYRASKLACHLSLQALFSMKQSARNRNAAALGLRGRAEVVLRWRSGRPAGGICPAARQSPAIRGRSALSAGSASMWACRGENQEKPYLSACAGLLYIW